MSVRVPLQFAKATMRLARPITDTQGRLVAGTGTRLEERVVRLLRRLAVQTVLVTDAEDLADWETLKPLEEALRDLDARCHREARSEALEQLRDAVARHLTRRADLLGAAPDGDEPEDAT